MFSWHSPTIECRTRYVNVFCLQPVFLSLWEGRQWHYPYLYCEEGNGVTSLWHTVRLVLLSSSILTHHLFPHLHVPSFFNSSFIPPVSSRLPFVILYTSSPRLSTEALYPSLWTPPHFRFYWNFLDEISLSPLIVLHSLLPQFTALLPLSLSHYPHLPPFRPPTLRIVLRFFGYCPCAGLFAATTLSRFWNSVATNAWLGLALAGHYAFYAVFASPSQDKLSGLWGGCSFTFHQCFTTFAYEKPLLVGFPRTWLLTKQYFTRNTQLKANNENFSFVSSTVRDLHTGSGIGASFWFHQSHRLPMLLHPLRHRGCLSDITGALFCSLGTLRGWFPVSPSFSVLFQSAFLHVFVTKWHFTYLVNPTIASLTPLLSWLKGAPPGINPSSRQQKKTWPGLFWCEQQLCSVAFRAAQRAIAAHVFLDALYCFKISCHVLFPIPNLFRILFRILFRNLFRNFKNVRKHRMSYDSLILERVRSHFGSSLLAQAFGSSTH